jgi:putative solute:sodium symporter small subunit
MTPDNVERHWSATRGLMFVMLFLWAFFAFGIHFFVKDLNQIVIGGFPLGFYMAAQGSLIAFVVILIVFASAQHGIDSKYGAAEDE